MSRYAFTGLWIAALAEIMSLSGVNLVYLPLVAIFVNPNALSKGGAGADNMACFFSLLTLISFYLESKWFYVLAVLLPLVRTDSAILSVLAFLARIVQILFEGSKGGGIANVGRRLTRGKRQILLASCVGLLGAVIVYAAVNAYAGSYGFLTLFNFTFINQFNPYPKTMPISHNIIDYIIAYRVGVSKLVASSMFPVYTLGIGLAIHRAYISRTVSRYEAIFIVIPIVFSFLHFIIFPEFQFRFFMFANGATLVALLRAIGRTSAFRAESSPA